YNASHEIGKLIGAIKQYNNYYEEYGFTPTITGGVTPGLIHLYYELYGPFVSFFLGGAVLLHKGGVEKGAKICAKIIEHSVGQRSKVSCFSKVKPLDEALVKEIKDAYVNSEYIIPREFIENNSLGSFVDLNWENWRLL
ncbi:hypothetical protein, partial [Piscirickettsia salmonis]